ncbi:IclR family transcriptional regulator domain-containing protein [Spirillospora sp. CA-255316]
MRAIAALGTRAPLRTGSDGKAILAHLPVEKIDRYLAAELPAVTPRMITDPQKLAEELALIRTKGYAVSDEELQEGVVSVAIQPLHGRPVCALSISAPKSRMPVSAQVRRRVRVQHGAIAAAGLSASAAIAATVTKAWRRL